MDFLSYRLDIGCIMVVLVIAILFFSVGRKNTKPHRIFSVHLIATLIHLIAEMGTFYIVSHLEEVPGWLNRLVYDIFLGLFLLIFLMVYQYVVALIEQDVQVVLKKNRWLYIPLGVSMVGVFVLPIYYVPEQYYTYGPAINGVYFSAVLCAVMAASLMFKYRKQIDAKKKMAITISFLSEFCVGVYQFFNPECLLSSIGVTMLCLGFYLTVESPDSVLVELLKDEKKKVEEAKEEAVMANMAKDKFLARMSHEIRTPINAILGMDEVILRESKEEDIIEYANDIKNAGHILLTLVNEILDLSKIESGKMEIIEAEYNICSVIDDLENMLSVKAKAENLGFHINVDEQLPSQLYGDDVRIRQILINLLSNAVKYTEQGKVELNVTGGVQGDSVLLHFEVKDTGIGIKKENQEKLFAEYKRIEEGNNRYTEGTGLGLTIVLRLLGMMGSKLQVESEYGKGSTFSFDLKQKIVDKKTIQQYRKEVKKVQKRKKESLDLSNSRILVVDDNAINRKVFIHLLRDTKAMVEDVDSGEACIEKMKENHYDIVFLDHMMPDMDGVETLKILKSIENYPSKNTPVIALTANAIVGAREKYLEKGFDGFVSKPIIVNELEEVLQKFVVDFSDEICENSN